MLLGISVQAANAGPLRPSMLRCEYLSDPIGIDVLQPRFSWALAHSERDQGQSAYRILVSADPEFSTPVFWDSGRVESSQSNHVVYGGGPLLSGRTYYWKVRYWDSDDIASPYSSAASFEMGLLSAGEWKGKWIGGGGLLRKQFALSALPTRARAYITALGHYELRINGKKVGDHVLDPGWTTYDKRTLYSTYDVGEHLRSGENVVGLMLGRGWTGPEFFRAPAPELEPAALLQLNVELEDGTNIALVSDDSWRALEGRIVADSLYHGETYDARLEKPGWDRPGYDDSVAPKAKVISPPGGALSAQMMPPIRVVDTIAPVTLTNPRPGVFVYDMGQNFTGWLRVAVSGPRGARVQTRFAESVYDDGMINTENLLTARATNVYILGGGGDEVFEPRFTYLGGRYVEVTGFPGTPSLGSVRGRVVHTAVEPRGGFSASHPLLNQIQRNVLWTQKTNLHSVPTDCPQRNEKMGWLGDAQISSETALLNFDMGAFYTNFLRNIRDVQGTDGTVTDTVPLSRYGGRPADPAWGMAFPIIAWNMYQHYGDRRILEENYDGIQAWMEYLSTRADNGMLSFSRYGDWVAIERAPARLVSTAYYYHGADLLAKMSAVLEKEPEEQLWRKRADEIKEAFIREYFDLEAGVITERSQGASALALYFGLVPEGRSRRAVNRLASDIVYRHNTHLTTGIHATKYLMEALSIAGRSDLAYDLAVQTDYPSWGYMIEKGATTIWEIWQHKTGPAMNSHNHPAFGSVGAWFYHALAGIRPDPSKPGFGRVTIAPQVVRDLNWASGSVQTLRGKVASAWVRLGNGLRVEVSISTGSEAEIHLPKLPGAGALLVKEAEGVVWKGGEYQAGVPGVRSVHEMDVAEDGVGASQSLIVETGSGDYVFEILRDQ